MVFIWSCPFAHFWSPAELMKCSLLFQTATLAVTERGTCSVLCKWIWGQTFFGIRGITLVCTHEKRSKQLYEMKRMKQKKLKAMSCLRSHLYMWPIAAWSGLVQGLVFKVERFVRRGCQTLFSHLISTSVEARAPITLRSLVIIHLTILKWSCLACVRNDSKPGTSEV